VGEPCRAGSSVRAAPLPANIIVNEPDKGIVALQKRQAEICFGYLLCILQSLGVRSAVEVLAGPPVWRRLRPTRLVGVSEATNVPGMVVLQFLMAL